MLIATENGQLGSNTDGISRNTGMLAFCPSIDGNWSPRPDETDRSNEQQPKTAVH
jgi:hypothetical protein